MRIAIIGAGFTGLAAALSLQKKGNDVSVFERDSQPGGLAIGYKEKEWNWTLEAFYHHWFTNDNAVLTLAKSINHPVKIVRPKTAVYIDKQNYQLDSPLSLLTFPKLNLVQKVHMGFALAFLKADPFWKILEKFLAAKVLPKLMGTKAYKMIWEPLLIGKFGDYANQISLAWFWARIVKRTPSLAYPEGGFLQFALNISKQIEKNGGQVMYNAPVEKIEEKDTLVSLGKFGEFDKVIVTLPSFAFVMLAPQLPLSYKEKLLSLKGLGATMLILRLKEKFFTDNTYWLSVCDSNAPVLAIVEHTNFMQSSHYNNEHILYLGNYLPKDHPYFTMTEKEMLKTFTPYLEKINPTFTKNVIGMKKFAVPFAQPIIPVNYSKQIPPFDTPLKNVFLANIQQVYPWDRGTNYAVELGEKIAEYIG